MREQDLQTLGHRQDERPGVVGRQTVGILADAAPVQPGSRRRERKHHGHDITDGRVGRQRLGHAAAVELEPERLFGALGPDQRRHGHRFAGPQRPSRQGDIEHAAARDTVPETADEQAPAGGVEHHGGRVEFGLVGRLEVGQQDDLHRTLGRFAHQPRRRPERRGKIARPVADGGRSEGRPGRDAHRQPRGEEWPRRRVGDHRLDRGAVGKGRQHAAGQLDRGLEARAAVVLLRLHTGAGVEHEEHRPAATAGQTAPMRTRGSQSKAADDEHAQQEQQPALDPAAASLLRLFLLEESQVAERHPAGSSPAQEVDDHRDGSADQAEQERGIEEGQGHQRSRPRLVRYAPSACPTGWSVGVSTRSIRCRRHSRRSSRRHASSRCR